MTMEVDGHLSIQAGTQSLADLRVSQGSFSFWLPIDIVRTCLAPEES
jgi:hypothetical protein